MIERSSPPDGRKPSTDTARSTDGISVLASTTGWRTPTTS